MNSADVYGVIGGALALAGMGTAALWHGVIVVSFSVRVVPPWSRKAPAPKKVPATTVPAGEAGRVEPPAASPAAQGPAVRPAA